MPILIQQLLKKGLLDKEKAASLEYEVKNSGKKEEEVILEKQLVSEVVLFALKGEELKIPFKEDVPAEEVSLTLLEMIPEESAKYYKMIPLVKGDDFLEVGMVYPEDLRAQEALKFLSRQGKFTCRIFLITLTTFNNLLKQYRTLRGEVKKALEELETELKVEKVEQTPTKPTEFERLVEEAPISKVVAVILRHAVEGGASDIHIEPTRDKLRIRFRLDGVLHSSILMPLRIHPAVIARIKILSNLKIDETRIPQDGRFSTKVDDKEIDFRVSTFPTALGEKVALRILDPAEGLKSFEDLGLEGRNFKVVKEAIEKPYGLILSTGPTGSGKTTTLYAILNILNKEGVNIVTLEDPIEYFVEGINQSQIKPEIGYDFATGLRHILRQDPNIIMVGEIRDQETANLATHAALTGHIVLSTLHTNDALGVIPRLVDLGVEPFLISPTLSVALAQRLVRKLCPFCKKKVVPPKKIKDLISKELASLPLIVKKDIPFSLQDIFVFEPVGCKKCNFKGYSGRIAVFEVLSMTSQLSETILKDLSENKIFEEAKRQGMSTMIQDGILKALAGVTSIEEVLRVTKER
ncbi:MAG: GspE/PulE family protein [Candidatus Pacebacteria bacterium]|nr:GspE/PulE family protein [Candidatus Paceibacterota bacterium]